LPQDLAEENLELDRREGKEDVGMSEGEATDGCQGVEALGPIGGGKGLEEEREDVARLGKRVDVGRGEILDEKGRERRRRSGWRWGYIQGRGGGGAGRPEKTTAECRWWRLWRRRRRRRVGDKGSGCKSSFIIAVLPFVVTPLHEALSLHRATGRRGDRTMPRQRSLLLLLLLLLRPRKRE